MAKTKTENKDRQTRSETKTAFFGLESLETIWWSPYHITDLKIGETESSHEVGQKCRKFEKETARSCGAFLMVNLAIDIKRCVRCATIFLVT